jgi:hypothetical protein
MVMELKDKIAAFINGVAASDDAHLFCREEFIHKLTFLVDIL